MSQGKVISGFPGIGKSTLVVTRPDILDSDSSQYDKNFFPNNYIVRIQEAVANEKTILVSSHDVVRAAMFRNNVTYILVYPQMQCKDEYLQRYRDRNSPEAFIALLDKHWEECITSCQNDPTENHHVLGPGEYLSDSKILF